LSESIARFLPTAQQENIDEEIDKHGFHKVACAFMGFGVSAAVLPLRIPQNRNLVKGMALFPLCSGKSGQENLLTLFTD
jgi:hypothetical protein